jgi:hypothetical protein
MKPRRKKVAEQKVHDRKATDVLKAIQGDLAVVVVDDPLEQGAQNTVVVNLRDDPLRKLKEMQSINHAQFEAGRIWQKYWEQSEIGYVQAPQIRERVQTSGPSGDVITERQVYAAAKLREAMRELGMEGEALIRDILGARHSIKEAAKRRGMESEFGARYIGQRFRECLETLAIVFQLIERPRA